MNANPDELQLKDVSEYTFKFLHFLHNLISHFNSNFDLKVDRESGWNPCL